MIHLLRKATVLGLTLGLAVSSSGCYYGYSSYYNNSSSQVKTTAAKEDASELKLSELKADDGKYEFTRLPWGSKYTDFETLIDAPIGTTSAFTDGETLGDVNYTYKILDYLTVGVEPLFDADGGLTMITFYFEQTYTADELDKIYEDIQAAAREEFGEEAKEESGDQSSGNLTYHTTTSFWYYEVSENEVTSLQLGKLSSNNATSAVVLGVNVYDPATIETESSEEGTGEISSISSAGKNDETVEASAEESTEK